MTTQTEQSYVSVDDRRARGEEAAKQTPLSSHAEGPPVADRPDPVELLVEQNATREPDLVPVRHGRMMVSPFTFYRGAAKVMAADLAGTPTAGLEVQLCGDAHLSNFGGFASPERQLLFGLNDFDETLPGPFEYDLKRMAASFTIAARNNGFTRSRCARGDGGVGEGLPGGDGGVRRRCAPWMSGTPTCPSSDFQEAMQAFQDEAALASAKPGKDKDKARASPARRRSRRRRPAMGATAGLATCDQGGHQGIQEGAHPRQPAGADPVRRGRRRPVPDRPASRRWWCRCGSSRDTWGLSRPDPRRRRGPVPRLPDQPQRGPAPAAGAVPHRRHGPQGGRRRQRRHPRVDGAAGGPRHRRPAVPAGQGGHPVGAGGPPAEQPFQHPRPAGGRRAAADAGHLRHLPRLDQGRPRRPLLLLAPAPRHEGLRGQSRP